MGDLPMPMMPEGTIQPGAAPAPTQGAMGGAPAPSLASSPGQSSALGGSPVGLSGSPDPRAILAKAQLLLKSGAISEQQYEMIVAKLQGGAAGAKPGAASPPGAPGPGGPPPSPLSTTGVPGGGPPIPAQGPSPQWNM